MPRQFDPIPAHLFPQITGKTWNDLTRNINRLNDEVFSLSKKSAIYKWFGKIVATGPLGTEDDYTDERYWVERVKISNTDASTTPLTFTAYVSPEPYDQTVTATNLAEVATDTHYTAINTIVEIYEANDVAVPINRRYYFSCFMQDVFFAKITSSASLATNRWKYAWTEQQMNGDSWEDKSGGRSGTTSSNYALNLVEANNDGSGVQGNGVNLSNLTGTFAIKAIAGDPVVQMHQKTDVNGTVKYYFSQVNAVDGTC